MKEKVIMEEGAKINYEHFHLGTCIVKFDLPMALIDVINSKYDETSKNLRPHNEQLAGKIADEKSVDEILSPNMRSIFQWCFERYLILIQKDKYKAIPFQAWINEMKSNEYNPLHYHTSPNGELGLSSVLMLKRPDWYGVEASREERPANGWLEFTGGDQAPLSVSQIRVDAKVGEFYVFPYSLLHGVYPFNSTDEVRRTMSLNCDVFRKEK